MNFNDIHDKLARTLNSMNARFDEDFKKHTNIQFVDTDGGTGVSLTFGKDDKYTVENKIILILQNLASLKDHLKKCLEKNGHPKNIIEDEINSSIHLQVLMDLANAEKHTYPTDSNRSKKHPVIKNASQGLRIGGTKAGDSSEINIGSDGHLIVHGVPPSITVMADIYDDNNNKLFSLNTLVETCFSKWEAIAKTYGCV